VRELWIAWMDQIGTDPDATTPKQENAPENTGLLRRVLNVFRRSEEL
jgi:hypothetical protein